MSASLRRVVPYVVLRRAMASIEGSQGKTARRRRPWRKPREEIGPGVPDELPSDQTAQPPVLDQPPVLEQPTAMDHSYVVDQSPALKLSTDSAPSNPDSVIEIDGSVMEGGGQILRNAMTFSCLLQKPIHIVRIRAGRDKPGLRPQHLTGIQLISELCQGKLEGDKPSSSEVTFHPGSIKAGSYTADPQTAGSTVLLLQAILPCLLYAPGVTNLTLRGGTNADMAPPIDYLTSVFTPMAKRFGVQFDCDVVRKGFYPRGKGEVKVKVHPVQCLTGASILDRGELTELSVSSFTAGAVQAKIGRQLASVAKNLLRKRFPSIPVTENIEHLTREQAFANGSGIIVLAKTTSGCVLGGSANGRKGEEVSVTGRKATEELISSIEAGGCVDEHLQDQLVVFMALARGSSSVKTGPLTLHTKTAIHIAETITRAKFTVRDTDDGGSIIECTGIGLEPCSH